MSSMNPKGPQSSSVERPKRALSVLLALLWFTACDMLPSSVTSSRSALNPRLSSAEDHQGGGSPEGVTALLKAQESIDPIPRLFELGFLEMIESLKRLEERGSPMRLIRAAREGRCGPAQLTQLMKGCPKGKTGQSRPFTTLEREACFKVLSRSLLCGLEPSKEYVDWSYAYLISRHQEALPKQDSAAKAAPSPHFNAAYTVRHAGLPRSLGYKIKQHPIIGLASACHFVGRSTDVCDEVKNLLQLGQISERPALLKLWRDTMGTWANRGLADEVLGKVYSEDSPIQKRLKAIEELIKGYDARYIAVFDQIARDYASGRRGLKQDLKKAKEYFVRSAEPEHQVYESYEPQPASFQRVMSWAACEHKGGASCVSFVSQYLLPGRGGPKDYQLALELIDEQLLKDSTNLALCTAAHESLKRIECVCFHRNELEAGHSFPKECKPVKRRPKLLKALLAKARCSAG